LPNRTLPAVISPDLNPVEQASEAEEPCGGAGSGDLSAQRPRFPWLLRAPRLLCICLSTM